jgi:RNA polymerase sigma-70 factor (ECF subfamily)
VEDRILIRGLKNGNQKSLEKLMDKYYNYVFTIIYNIMRGSATIEDIEEIAADAFVKLWNNRNKLDSKYKSIKPYLASISRNTAINYLKAMGDIELPLEEDFLILDIDGVEEKILDKELSQILNQCIKKLEEPDREIIVRYYFFYEKVKDIAVELNMNESTVKTKLFRSREKLKNMLVKGGLYNENRDDGLISKSRSQGI